MTGARARPDNSLRATPLHLPRSTARMVLRARPAVPHGPVPWDVLTRSFLDYLRWQVARAEGAQEGRGG